MSWTAHHIPSGPDHVWLLAIPVFVLASSMILQAFMPGPLSAPILHSALGFSDSSHLKPEGGNLADVPYSDEWRREWFSLSPQNLNVEVRLPVSSCSSDVWGSVTQLWASLLISNMKIIIILFLILWYVLLAPRQTRVKWSINASLLLLRLFSSWHSLSFFLLKLNHKN